MYRDAQAEEMIQGKWSWSKLDQYLSIMQYVADRCRILQSVGRLKLERSVAAKDHRRPESGPALVAAQCMMSVASVAESGRHPRDGALRCQGCKVDKGGWRQGTKRNAKRFFPTETGFEPARPESNA